ncbi:MAG TPA: DUF433 domain-containing protein [Humisphaera sp.]|nr:DUF433 domain-containing protein [Humisphaera sp.]
MGAAQESELDMVDHSRQLSSKTIAVLEMIAAGCSYEQILAAYPDLTYLDIFRAATEALDKMSQQEANHPAYQVAEIRKSYPRAYEKWTDNEDRRLRELIDGGLTVARIARRLQRQRGAIRSRIRKLDLVGALSPKEQARLHRISKLDPVPADPSDDPNEDV